MRPTAASAVGHSVAAALAEEREIPPQPPERGLALTWHRAANGAIRREDEASSGKAVVSNPLASPGASTPLLPADALGASPGATVTLPPPPAPWKFREQTSAWADQTVAKLLGAVPAKGNPAVAIAARAIRGALMHREVYRDSAQRPDLNDDAFWLAAAIVAASFLGVWLSSYGGWFSSFGFRVILNLAAIQVIGWVCAVFAIQIAAKKMHQLHLAPLALFRGLIFAQAPSLLSFVPVIGGLSGLWSGACTAAALHDLTGRKTNDAIILTFIGGAASGLGGYIVRTVLS